MFGNRTLFIATKHKKEEVIQPVFESYFLVNCAVPENFDSDVLGTFSGEVERTLSPVEAAREKCQLVIKKNNADLVIASEGSFYPHPLTGFIPLDEEILMFLDTKNDLEIKVVERSIKTNFCREQLNHVNDLLKFAEKAGFPSHGLILKGNVNGRDKYFKGIVDHRILMTCFNELKKITDAIYVETDMRALFNPTRMQVIKQGALKLADKIKSQCPKCTSPGFGAEKSITGLKCSQCSLPTKSVRAHVYQCQKCFYEQEIELSNNKKEEDPMYCDFCNP
jgi:hypothetical protein